MTTQTKVEQKQIRMAELDGLTMRSVEMQDLEAAIALFNTCSLEQIGKEQFEVEDIKGEWESPSFDLERDTRVVVSPEGELVGYVEVWDTEPHVRLYSWGRVHPECRGQGIGTALMQWAEGRARKAIVKAPAGTQVSMMQQTLTTDEVTQALFRSQGFDLTRYFFRMLIEMEEAPPEPLWPAGIEIRTFDREEDLEALILANQDAFRDHWGFVERSLEESLKRWEHWIESNPDFDPTLWYLAMDGTEIAGICLAKERMTEDPDLGWVDTLGVRRPWRRQGLGLAMLHHCFGELYRRGKPKVGLGVDAGSLTGATRLYEKAGMHVQRQYAHYEKVLRAGKDLSTQTLEG